MAGVRVVAAILLVGALGAAPASASGLDAKAAAQIAELQRLKGSLSKAERKLDSRLAVMLERGSTVPGVRVSKGATEVDVRATAVTGDLLDRLKDAGAEIEHASRRVDSVRASLPLGALRRVAGFRDVVAVDVAVEAITHQEVVVSEGDKAHAADLARQRRRVSGTGVKLCALSDGVDSLAASQTARELPAVDVLPGEAGDGDEGTAMLEILHDLAPKAELGFATAFTSDASFADNIRELRSAGCDVIVDDVLYFNEHPFQDGPIARAVNDVTADGALFFSSAGNEGNVMDGTAANWEGDFVDSGLAAGKFAGAAHDFDPGPGVQIWQPISPQSSGNIPVTLFWADPLRGAANDYDLYLFDANSNVISFSQDVQDGNDDPYEILGTPLFGGPGLRLAVVKFRGADRYFQLSALGSRFKNSADGLVAHVTAGVLRGHAAAVDAFAVAAAPAAEALPFDLEPGDPPNPTGPFESPFTRAQLPERFTSDGPRRMFFHPDGTPITPNDFSATGGTLRAKPDITAADGVNTSLGDFAPFFGTSAAAPHAAAIAGLILSGNPGFTTTEVREAFNATALDLAPAGVDSRTGAGIIRADRVLAYTGATPEPLVRAAEPVVSPLTGDGDIYLEPGETANLGVPVANVGDGTATGINVTVTTNDPTVTVAPRARSYGNLAAGATRSRDFRLTLPADYPRGKRFEVAVRVTFAGRLSPTTASYPLSTGEPSLDDTVFAYTGDALPIPDDDDNGITVTIPVSGIGYASKVRFSIDGTACTTTAGATTVGIDHTFVGDLVGTLTSPSGRTVRLMDRDGSGGNNLCQVMFDDAATRSFANAATANNPFTGLWRPNAGRLEDFLLEPVDGDWTFKVADVVGRDTGTLRAVSVVINGFVE